MAWENFLSDATLVASPLADGVGGGGDFCLLSLSCQFRPRSTLADRQGLGSDGNLANAGPEVGTDMEMKGPIL